MIKSTSHYGLWLAALSIVVLTISGCGIKPKHLAAPEGTDQNAFPRSYPSSP